METFLEQPEATFYHISTEENYNNINQNGINSRSGRIFASRVGELPVLLAIALEQLPEIYKTTAIVVWKLPQGRNEFTLDEIIPDNQAQVEWTQPFQNIILRTAIPRENIELMMRVPLNPNNARDFLLTFLTSIANQGQQNYQNHFIKERAQNLNYENN